MNNLYAALRAAFPQDLTQWAVETDTGLVYSWNDLEAASAKFANLLASLNLPAQSRIAVQVEKSVESMLLYLACLRAGHVYLPLNTAYQKSEMAYFIDNAKPAVLVCRPESFTGLSQLAFTHGTQHVFTLGEARDGSLIERAAHHSEAHTVVDCGPDALAAIIYTSGTTGRSKGAMLSHGNLLSNAQVLKAYWGWRPDDVLIHALPIFHVHGLFVAIHGALINGSPMRWHGKFDPKRVIADMARATVFMGVPTLYVRMLAEAALTPDAVRGMRLFISGSAPLLTETFRDWQTRTGLTILERYGMSETIMLTSNPYSADAAHRNQFERRGGTVGFPLPGVDVRIHGDQGEAVPQGDIGGIQVRGPGVFSGYWQMPEKTKEEFTPDGWFKTGDVGRMDADGYVTIVGRSKDLIISGGYNVYPAEIESILNDMPGVAESAVVGVPHADFGEVGVAVVIAKPGAKLDAQAMLATLKGELANFKIPKHLHIASELPRNAMGKVQKNLLRAEWANHFDAP